MPAEKLTLPWELATVADAVMFEPSKPNEMLFAFESVTAETFALFVPPETLMLPWTVPTDTLAVIVDPLSPKLTLFELLKTAALRFCDVVPALKLTAVNDDATLAVTTEELLIPNETPFEFEKTTVPLVAV